MKQHAKVTACIINYILSPYPQHIPDVYLASACVAFCKAKPAQLCYLTPWYTMLYVPTTFVFKVATQIKLKKRRLLLPYTLSGYIWFFGFRSS